MKRSSLNFIVDLVAFLDLLGLAFTGFIMKYILPPGTGGLCRELRGDWGRGQHVKQLWSMTRHEWGRIHFYLAIFFVVLMIVHIILHWNWLKNYVKSFFSASQKDRCL